MKTLRILHLEDSWSDAFLVNETLKKDGIDAEFSLFCTAIPFDEAESR